MNPEHPDRAFSGAPRFWGAAVFCEEFHPERSSLFDEELDEIVKAHALDKKTMRGCCNVLGGPTTFALNGPHVREDVVAAGSGSVNRQRQIVCALSTALFSHPYASLPQIAEHVNRNRLTVYTAEANAALFAALQKSIAPDLFFFSEYLGPDKVPGQVVNGVRHEDLQNVSFADESFDVVLTSEVFEHVPDAPRAEREVIRILKKGGVYCFTVPFLPLNKHDVVMAEVDETGNIRHHTGADRDNGDMYPPYAWIVREPLYHFDPVRPDEGVLVYRLFSFYDLEQRFTDLGCVFTTYRFWSKTLGVLGADAFVMVAKKPAAEQRTFTSQAQGGFSQPRA